MPWTWKNSKTPALKDPAAKKATPPLTHGSMRYEILCDRSIKLSGVFWTKVVPAGASTAEIVATQAEMNEALKKLPQLKRLQLKRQAV